MPEFGDTTRFVRKLQSLILLSEDERTAAESLPIRIVDVKADQDVVREGDRPSRSVMVLEGIACTSKVTGQGRRQIMGFHISGDIPDLQSLHLEVLDNDLQTITAAKFGFIDHIALRDLCNRFPRIGAALWRTTLIDAAIFREWMANIGQRQAYSRLAHVFCEMMLRMKHVGLADGDECELPLTQTDLSEATGMSVVHVNRTLQELRKSGLLSFARGVLKIHDWDALVEAGDFDPTYLHLGGHAPLLVAANSA